MPPYINGIQIGGCPTGTTNQIVVYGCGTAIGDNCLVIDNPLLATKNHCIVVDDCSSPTRAHCIVVEDCVDTTLENCLVIDNPVSTTKDHCIVILNYNSTGDIEIETNACSELSKTNATIHTIAKVRGINLSIPYFGTLLATDDLIRFDIKDKNSDTTYYTRTYEKSELDVDGSQMTNTFDFLLLYCGTQEIKMSILSPCKETVIKKYIDVSDACANVSIMSNDYCTYCEDCGDCNDTIEGDCIDDRPFCVEKTNKISLYTPVTFTPIIEIDDCEQLVCTTLTSYVPMSLPVNCETGDCETLFFDPCPERSITWNIISKQAQVPGCEDKPINYPLTVTLTTPGFYTIQLVYTDLCGKTYTTSVDVETEMPFKMIKQDCNRYKVSRCDGLNFNYTYELEPFVKDAFVPGVVVMNGNQDTVINVGGDGIYRLRVVNPDDLNDVKEFLIVEFCAIFDCIRAAMNAIICSECVDCIGQEQLLASYNLNREFALFNTYIALVNKSVEDSRWTFSVDNLGTLRTLNDYFKKLQQICNC